MPEHAIDNILLASRMDLIEFNRYYSSDAESSLNVLMLGDRCGKTALLRRFKKNQYSDRSRHTDAVNGISVVFQAGGFYCDLYISDVGSKLDRREFEQTFLVAAQAILICFDCTSEKSFSKAKRQLKKIEKSLFAKGAPIILVATKVEQATVEQREVSREAAKEFAVQTARVFNYVETSAKQGYNVALPFVQAAVLAKLRGGDKSIYLEKVKMLAVNLVKEKMLASLLIILNQPDNVTTAKDLFAKLKELKQTANEIGEGLSAILDQLRTEDGLGLLGFLAREDKLACLNVLCRHTDMNLELVDRQGRNALFWATKQGSVSSIAYLLKQGATAFDSLELVEHLQKLQSESDNPKRYSETIKKLKTQSFYLLDTEVRKNDATALAELLNLGHSVNSKSRHGRLAFTTALRKKRITCASLLLAHGARLNFSSQERKPPLYLVAREKLVAGKPEQRKLLVSINLRLLESKLRENRKTLKPFLDALFVDELEKETPSLPISVKLDILEKVGFSIRNNSRGRYNSVKEDVLKKRGRFFSLQQYQFSERQNQHLLEVKDYYLQLIGNEPDDVLREQLAISAQQSQMLGIHRHALEIATQRFDFRHLRLCEAETGHQKQARGLIAAAIAA